MNVTIQAAIIGALFTFFGALLTTLINYYRERSERERWRRTFELEEQRARHEEIKWALDLNNQREIELHKMRLRTYPEVFAALGRLSQHTIDQLTEGQIRELADRFNEWGYGEAGLCMLPDTRDAIFVLRRSLVKFADKKISPEELMAGPRTDLIELMRRDSNHDWSRWRGFKTLTEVNRERVRKMLDPSNSG